MSGPASRAGARRDARALLVAVPLLLAAAPSAISEPAPPAAPSAPVAPSEPAPPAAPLATLPPAPATQRVTLEASTEPRAWSPALLVRLHGADPADLDAPVDVPLTRDPARQGFYTAEVLAPARRFLDVELVVTDGAPATLWRRVVPAEDPDAVTLSFLVEQDGPRASRVAWLPWVGGGNTVGNTVTLAVAFGWGALCLGYVGWLARARAPR